MKKCKDCELLIRMHGIHNLSLCEYCEHYYKGAWCSCSDAQREKKLYNEEQTKPEQVVFT